MYQCRYCGFSCFSLKKYVEHMSVHRFQNNSKFPCGVPECSSSFSSYSAFSMHVTRYHQKKRRKNYSQDINLTCSKPLCKKTFDNVRSLFSHLNWHIQKTGKIKCCFKGCTREYRVQSSFSSHVSRVHNYHDISSIISQDSFNENAHVMPSIETETLPLPMVNEQTSNLGEIQALGNLDKQLNEHTKNIGLFCLLLDAKHLVPNSTIQLVIQEMSTLFQIESSFFYDNFLNKLKNINLSDEQIDQILKSAKEVPSLTSVLDKTSGIFRSRFVREKYLKENLKFVKPVEVYLGRDKRNKPCYFHYVPIKDTLLNLLQDKSVKNQLDNPLHNTNLLTDFTDGSIHTKNANVAKGKILHLILYQDAFETVNPLGSAKRKHKLLGFYFTLGNFYPWHRSSVDQMQLLILCYEKHIKLFGQKSVFNILIEDLKMLEDGFFVNGEYFEVRVFCISSDNLGAHFIAGFKQNFSTSDFFCRYCLITRTDFSTQDYPILSGSPRTEFSYDLAVLELQNENSFEGILYSSLFNKLKHFHVCRPGLPPCIGHDLFEGVCDYDLSLYLNYFLKEKWFSIEFLNFLITDFKFMSNDALCKPACFQEKSKRLSGNACQNWALIRFLPVMLYNKIDANDPVWKLVIMLKEIVEYVCAPQISLDQVAEMKLLINEYLEQRKSIFSDVPLRPKHHYMQHYPDLTVKFGPLIRLWTLRFESKHSYFKRVVAASKNFKNLTSMLSNKHQLLQAYLMNGVLFSEEWAPEKSFPFNLLHYNTDMQNAVKNVVVESRLSVCEKITIRGVQYSIEQFICIERIKENNNCLFGKIMLILFGQRIYFIVKCVIGEWDYEHGLYELQGENSPLNVICVDVKDLKNFYPLSCYSRCNLNLITLKHKLC